MPLAFTGRSGLPYDGYDTIEWLAEQPWCTGKVGMMGTPLMLDASARFAVLSLFARDRMAARKLRLFGDSSISALYDPEELQSDPAWSALYEQAKTAAEAHPTRTSPEHRK